MKKPSLLMVSMTLLLDTLETLANLVVSFMMADKCVEILMRENEDMTCEEAEEYLEFNTFGAYVGKHGPVFISMGEGSE